MGSKGYLWNQFGNTKCNCSTYAMQTTLKENKAYQMSINMILKTLELINLANEDCKDCVNSSEEHSHLVINYVYSEMPNTNIFFSSQLNYWILELFSTIQIIIIRPFYYPVSFYFYKLCSGFAPHMKSKKSSFQ